jgi:thioredoxin 1
MISTITKENFDQEVLKSEKPFLLEFWASWCAPCTMMAATMDSLNEEYGDSIVFGKINADENEEIVEKYTVRGLPTVLLFFEGKVVETFVGLTPKDNMQNILKYHI